MLAAPAAFLLSFWLEFLMRFNVPVTESLRISDVVNKMHIISK